MYDAFTDQEFGAISKKSCKYIDKKVLKPNINYMIRKKVPLLTKSRNSTSKSPKRINKLLMFSFPKAKRELTTLSSSNINQERFAYNPRSIFPDPYELTHRK